VDVRKFCKLKRQPVQTYGRRRRRRPRSDQDIPEAMAMELMKQRKEPIIKRIKRDKWPLVMLAPTIVLLFLFSYLPIYGVVIAFQNYKIGNNILSFGGATDWVGLKFFISFVKSIFFTRVFGNTLRLSVETLVFGFWVPIVFALMLNEIRA
jgi:putative aldouronate transport system permease protein